MKRNLLMVLMFVGASAAPGVMLLLSNWHVVAHGFSTTVAVLSGVLGVLLSAIFIALGVRCIHQNSRYAGFWWAAADSNPLPVGLVFFFRSILF